MLHCFCIGAMHIANSLIRMHHLKCFSRLTHHRCVGCDCKWNSLSGCFVFTTLNGSQSFAVVIAWYTTAAEINTVSFIISSTGAENVCDRLDGLARMATRLDLTMRNCCAASKSHAFCVSCRRGKTRRQLKACLLSRRSSRL